MGEETLIYATVENAAGIRSLHLWQSGSSSQRFDYVGPVLEAVGDEGQVGMTHVAYDRDDADAPFKMWYSTRYSARATAIAYATSYDGKAWDRKGMVYSPTLPSEAAGLTVDFVCRDKSGDWRLFYSGLESVDCIRAMAATSRKPSGPFVSPRVIMAPDAAEYAGGAEVTNDDLSLTLTGTPMPAPGFPYVLTDGTQSGSGLVFIERVAGNIAYLRNPAGLTAEGYRLLSVHARKVSPSYYCQSRSGGRGYFTGFGAISGVTIEYVFAVEERDGRFYPIADDEVFRPTSSVDQFSFENPVPISSSADCPPC